MAGFYRGFGALIVQYALQLAIVRFSTFSIRVKHFKTKPVAIKTDNSRKLGIQFTTFNLIINISKVSAMA
jgi:hypothetical protein